jgi:hypothetical protein
MEGSCSTGQSPQWAVVPVEEEEDCAGQGRCWGASSCFSNQNWTLLAVCIGKVLSWKSASLLGGKKLDHRMHHVVPSSNSTTQSNYGTSILPRYCCLFRHRSASIFHSWNQAFRIIKFLGPSPNINPTWRWEKHEGLNVWLYYVLPCIRHPVFVIIHAIL